MSRQKTVTHRKFCITAYLDPHKLLAYFHGINKRTLTGCKKRILDCGAAPLLHKKTCHKQSRRVSAGSVVCQQAKGSRATGRNATPRNHVQWSVAIGCNFPGDSMFKNSIRVISLLGFLILIAHPALGQARSSSADLSGVVRVSSKSPVSGAAITATNLATGLSRTVKTDAMGTYRITLLPPGQYEVRIEVQGFNRQIKKGIILTVGQIAVINFEVTHGTADEDQVIETDAPVVETERTHQAQTITQRPINKLPINGRNFLDFT